MRIDKTNSSYGDDSDRESQTISLYSAITNYVYENGRRYHSYRYGTYWGPNDDLACENLDLFHHIFTLALDGKLFLAPIRSDPQRVLDLGTGTGIWAIDFADQFPSASVIATDLSPIQPAEVPPNLEFQIDDFCEPWTFTKDTFDFIHARSIYGCVADYSTLYAEVRNHLKPGGWFEQVELAVELLSEDGSTRGTSLEMWGPIALEAGDRFGKTLRIVDETKEHMEAAGFVNITYRKYKWPVGPWPKERKLKEIGAYNLLGWEDGIVGWAMFLFTKYLGWSPEEVYIWCAKIRKELRNRAIHGYHEMSVCFGQRPLNDSGSEYVPG